MSLSSIFGGPEPTKIAATESERSLGRAADRLTSRAGTLGTVANRFFSNLATEQTARRNRRLGAANADIAQRTPAATSKGAVISNSLNRSRASSRAQGAAGRGFDMEQLRARIAATKHLRARQGGGVAALSSASGNELTLAGANQQADQMHEGAVQNLIGTGLGALTRFGVGAWQNRALSSNTITPEIRGVDLSAFASDPNVRHA